MVTPSPLECGGGPFININKYGSNTNNKRLRVNGWRVLLERHQPPLIRPGSPARWIMPLTFERFRVILLP